MARGIDQLLSDPVILAGVTVVAGVAIIVSALLLGPTDDWLDAWKIRILPSLHPISLFVLDYPLVVEKDLTQEFIVSAKPTPDELDDVWGDDDWTRSVLSNVKYRVLPDGTVQYAIRQWVYRGDPLESDEQQHVYEFPATRAPTWLSDVYGHLEASTLEGDEHVGGDDQDPGDPAGVARGTLAAAGVPTTNEPDEGWTDPTPG